MKFLCGPAATAVSITCVALLASACGDASQPVARSAASQQAQYPAPTEAPAPAKTIAAGGAADVKHCAAADVDDVEELVGPVVGQPEESTNECVVQVGETGAVTFVVRTGGVEAFDSASDTFKIAGGDPKPLNGIGDEAVAFSDMTSVLARAGSLSVQVINLTADASQDATAELARRALSRLEFVG